MYSEIVIYIKPEYKPSQLSDVLKPILQNADFNEKMVNLEPYDKGERGYNELVLLINLQLFKDAQILGLIKLIQENLEPYACLESVEEQYTKFYSGTSNLFKNINQGKTDYSLGLKRVYILYAYTCSGRNIYKLKDEDGNQYEKRGYEIKIVNNAWYLK